MRLLTDSELNASPIVANNRMNRQRVASGINSYEKEFGFKPGDFLVQKIHDFGQASWLDLCCGEGQALVQVADLFTQQGIADQVRLKGIDLIGDFRLGHERFSCIQWEQRSLQGWQTNDRFDLVTIVHGLHYIGDKLSLISNAVNSLKPGGLFIAHLDLDNLVIDGKKDGRFFKTNLMHQGFVYNGRTKVLQHPGSIPVSFELNYLGADDSSGPNYTGQDAVTSHYSRKVI